MSANEKNITTSIRISRQLWHKLASIADEREEKSRNAMIEDILEYFVIQYEAEQQAVEA